MSDVAESIRAWLLDHSIVTDLVANRIYPDMLPQNPTLPAVVMTKLSVRHDHQLSDLAGLAHARVQFDCYSLSRGEANGVAEAIRATGITALKGETHGTDIRGVELEEGQRNFTEPPNDATDEFRYGTNFDLMVSYTEELPWR